MNKEDKVMGGQGWDGWGNHVLEELKRLNCNYETINREINSIKMDIAALKVKSGVWGTVGGVLTVAIYIIFQFVMAKK